MTPAFQSISTLMKPSSINNDDEYDGYDDYDDDRFPYSKDETSSLIHRQNSSELRKRVKSIDQANFHEDAVKTCDQCPDLCFQTFCGIHFHPLNFCLMTLWTSGILFFFAMVGGEIGTKWSSINAETSTSVSYHHTHHLDFPAITICNMAQEVPLTPVRCSSFDSNKECPEYKIPIHLLDSEQKTINDNTGDSSGSGSGSGSIDESSSSSAVDQASTLSGKEIGSESGKEAAYMNITETAILQSFNLTDDNDLEKARVSHRNKMRHCLVFNNNKNSQYSTRHKGLADALTVVLRINIDEYPPHARYSGVHIDLHAQCDRALGECPEELDSTLVAAPGSPRFYRMTKHHHMYLNGTRTEYYEAKDSASGDYDFERHFGSVNDTVVVTFLYADMSLMEAREMPR